MTDRGSTIAKVFPCFGIDGLGKSLRSGGGESGNDGRESDRNDTYNICYAHAIRSILAVSLIQLLEFREEQQERQQ